MNYLFSYGTLQLEKVQMDIFGRILSGTKEKLRRYKVGNLKIMDPDVIKSSGMDIHPILIYTGNEIDSIEGILFELSDDEILLADKYEVADYQRKKVVFDSGKQGYVYVK